MASLSKRELYFIGFSRGMHSSKSRHEGMIFACGTTGTHLSRPWTYGKISLKEEAF